MTSTLNGEYLLNKTWHRQSDNGTGKHEWSPTLSKKFHELWSTNGLKWDRLFTHLDYFVPSQSIRHPLIGINVAPHSDSITKTALDLSAGQIQSPTRC